MHEQSGQAQENRDLKPSTVEVVDLRNPNHLQKYPFLLPIKEAVTCMYDFLVQTRGEKVVFPRENLTAEEMQTLYSLWGISQTELDDLATPDPDQEKQQAKEQRKRMIDEQVAEAFQRFKDTIGQCDLTCEGILDFLYTRYTGEYEGKLYEANRGLSHFLMHEVLVLKHLETQKYVALSIGNVFNQNLTLPTLENQEFARATSLFVSDSEPPLLEAVSKVEGGNKWKDITRDFRIRKQDLADFIMNWNDV